MFKKNNSIANKAALILCLDGNKINKYEYECLLNIDKWRSVQHSLNNIDIFVYYNKYSNISKSILDKIAKYRNVYIKYYDDDFCQYYSDKFKYQCKNLHMLYSQYLFETYETNYDYGLCLDLDMFLIKELPYGIFSEKNIFCIYHQLDRNQTTLIHWKRQESMISMNIPMFKASFILNFRQNKLAEKLIRLVDTCEFNMFFEKYIWYKNNQSNIFYHEGLYDYAYKTGIINENNSVLILDSNLEVEFDKNASFTHQHIKSLNEYLKMKK